MITFKTFAACALFAMLASAAQAQEINTFASADAGTMAKVNQMRATGNSFSQTWTPATTFSCGTLNVGSTPGQPTNDNAAIYGQPPTQTQSVDMPNAVTRQDGLQTQVYTGIVTNFCNPRP